MKIVISKLPVKYNRIGQGIFYGFWLFILGVFLINSATRAYDNLRDSRNINGPFDPVSMEVYSYIKEETAPDSVLIFYKPAAMRLMTGHDTIMINQCKGLFKGDYFILSKKVVKQPGTSNKLPHATCPLTKYWKTAGL